VPTFFVNGKRLHGPYDTRSLIRALTADDVRAADEPADESKG